jgi:DNA ligase D-like protein (predicted ligase)
MKNKMKKTAQPSFIAPMLATLTTDYFSSTDWIYEHKFDGIRCLAVKRKGTVHLMSRNDRLINHEYPEIVKALEAQKTDSFILDGEIVATSQGLSDFELLQSRINLKNTKKITSKMKLIPITFCIFDLLYTDGYDVRHLPLLERKKMLKKLLRYNKLLLYTEHQVGDGIAFFKNACKAKWEGAIAKKADSIYESRRSRNWLKFKCIMQQELVIGGYTEPRGERNKFGALLVGYFKGTKFMYAGKVGTGFDFDTIAMLYKKMKPLEIKKCPFTNFDISPNGVHWIKPKLVAEFQFAEWTRSGKLRVGRYKGLRTDKAAKLVVKEMPKALPGTHKKQ